MTQASPGSRTRPSTAGYRGGLARSLVRTLLALTLIPLALMGGAAYVRARTLLRDQVVGQMQAQITGEVEQVDLSIKTKEIRLDRLVRSSDFVAAASRGAVTSPESPDIAPLQSDFDRITRSISPQGGKPIFNQYLFVSPSGRVQLASKPDWLGVDLHELPIYANITTGDHTSFAAFNAAPLYANALVLMTVSKFQGASGVPVGDLIGITESPELQGILQNLSKPSSGAQALYITQDGTIIGTDQYTNQMTPIDAPQTETTPIMAALAPMMHADQVRPASVEFTDKQGARGFGQVLWLKSMQVGIVYAIDEQRIFGPLTSLIPFTVAIFIAALAAMGGVLTLGAARVFGPLAALADNAQGFAQGDFSQRAVVRTKDEIGLLAESFNHMAEELSSLYRSLERRVEERTRQMRTAAAVAERITSTTNVRELLDRTARLLVEQFPFYQAGVFLLDRAARFAILEASYGPAAEELLARGHRLEVGSASIIGWVSANNQPRIASDVADDPFHLRNELLPQTRSEIGVPIAAGSSVLGVLDVQSTQPDAFGTETVVMLQTLANQLAAAIQNMGLAESSQTNLQEIQRVQAASPEILDAGSSEEAFATTAGVLSRAPYPAVILAVKKDSLELQGRRDPGNAELVPLILALPVLDDNLAEIRSLVARGTTIVSEAEAGLPAPMQEFRRQCGYSGIALVPVRRHKEVVGLIVVGSPKKMLSASAVGPYTAMAELLGSTLRRLSDAADQNRQLSEQRALASITQPIAGSEEDLGVYFAELHAQVKRNIGDYAFSVVLHNPIDNTIRIPYAGQGDRVEKTESFAVGEGLISIVLRGRQPMLLAKDVEQQALRLGARTTGSAPRSWMGAPLLVQDGAVGALIVQDVEREGAFDDTHLRFLADLAQRAAAVVSGTRLLGQSRTHAHQLETAAQIARDISMSLDLDELLARIVSYLHERLGYLHAAVFLVDARHEFAVIREASGEAGAQMKRQGHRLGVGSRSIVGFAAGRGEPLIVNDTSSDATYRPNPLLPETRSEAAVPLRVGDRIVGVMDVQSNVPGAFQQDDVRTLQILADQLAVAVVNSELFAEVQEHLAQQRLLQHITASAASGTTLAEALDSAVEGLQVTLGGDRVSILLPDRDGKALEVSAARGYSEDVMRLRIPAGSGITGWSAAHRQALRVPNVAEDPRYIEGSANTRSELAVPLIYRNEVLGVLNVESEQPDAYTENHEEMLTTLAGSLAAIIANARLLAKVRAQAERERTVFEISDKIRRATGVQSVLATTANELTQAVGARGARIRITGRTGESGSDKDDA